MTDEETIKVLEQLIPVPTRGDGKGLLHLSITEALMTAIEALKPKTAYWVNGRCNHCGCDAPKTSVPEMGGYSITVQDLTNYCPRCGYKMEKE